MIKRLGRLVSGAHFEKRHARAGASAALHDRPQKLRGETLPGISSGSLADIERARILAALARHHGRKAAAAAELGISRTTLWRKLYAHRLR